MTGGMATLAGGVLAAYVAFLGGDDPAERLKFAKHLLAASFMAAPGAVLISKILVPQTEAIDSSVEVTKENWHNVLMLYQWDCGRFEACCKCSIYAIGVHRIYCHV